jgi:ABC-type uncharacterized transport system permease subunit
MKMNKAVYLELAGISIAVLAALLFGIAVILLSSHEPAQAIHALFIEPFSSAFNIGTVFNKVVPLIFTGLSLSLVFQSGVFSMGAEGQLYIGAFVGSLAALYIPGLPVFIHFPIILICAMVSGALFGAIPGLLRIYWNANEIVTTLMLNFIAILTASYFVNKVFNDPTSGGYARMTMISKNLLLGHPIKGFPAHSGMIIAIVAIAVTYILLYKTKIGYELRLVGKNSQFARYGGISTKRVIMTSIMLSGALAGLAGIVEILGIHGTYKDNFSNGLGFDGIIIALLARNHPIGVLIAAFFYGYIQVGSQLMQVGSDMPRQLAVIIQVMLVLLVSSQAIFIFLKQRFFAGQKAVK